MKKRDLFVDSELIAVAKDGFYPEELRATSDIAVSGVYTEQEAARFKELVE
jgi:hypothetical protein